MLSGSPPRMRGKQRLARLHLGLGGITPAHAGKTPRRPFARQAAGDHPRACGENSVSAAVSRPEAGSPPRMRGKPGAIPWDCAVHRITPAHAGKTRQK